MKLHVNGESKAVNSREKKVRNKAVRPTALARSNSSYLLGVALVLVVCLFTACSSDKPDRIAELDTSLPEVIDYNFHVRPILSDNCFACHGPDAENQKAGLRLDEREAAVALLESGSGHAIVPGKLGKSEAWLRLISEDPDLLMPPPNSHLKLSNKEIAILARWIEQGAEYKPHWAFQSLRPVDPPQVDNVSWVRAPIDAFILEPLEREGWEPSPEAAKETLIRRVTFDLTGLPPGLGEIDHFLADDSPDAYEKLVDRLLASPAYGERMAATWMDVARYADSDGYLDDKHRDFTPWRSWVIEAFNENMPYDQFITWQLAGDLIPDAGKESTLATAFNRLHKKNSEAGIVFEEYRVEYVADRTNTLGTGIMGLSLECARCHDHKYDPISQKNYFELFAFFNSTFEIGTPVYGPGQVPGPSLLLSSEEEDLRIDELRAMIARQEEQLSAAQTKAATFNDWLPSAQMADLSSSIRESMTAYYPLDQVRPTDQAKTLTSPEATGSGKNATLRQAIMKEGAKGKAFFVSDYNKLKLGEGVGWYDRTDPFSFQVAVRPDTIYPEAGILWHSESIRLGLKGYSLHVKDNHLQFIIARSWPQNALQVTTMDAIPVREWSEVTVTYDGSSKASGISLYVDGEKQEVTIDYDNLYKSILFEPNIHTYGFEGITLGARDKFIPFKKGGIDEIKIFDRELSALEVLFIHDRGEADQILNDRRQHLSLLQDHYAVAVDPEVSEVRERLKKVRDEENEYISDIQEIMVMGDRPTPRPTFLLERGVYSEPREEVHPNTPERVLPFDEGYPKNRLGLTQWLFDDKNPLTARVFVNRIWQMHFGKGIVETAEDFGAQGSLPSHPELLDWLAVHFVESGWDIKALHKMIVLSATYRQSSKVTPELLEKDPENVYLARGPRYRLPAEMIRDNALAVSGLLVNQQGGESVYPYQPEGLWDGLTTKHWAYRYLQEPGDGLYRRSLYSIWKRASPPPGMLIFDVADRGVCTVRRKISNTPLQALALLNDPQYVEASRVLAEQLITTEEDTSARLTKAFRLPYWTERLTAMNSKY